MPRKHNPKPGRVKRRANKATKNQRQSRRAAEEAEIAALEARIVAEAVPRGVNPLIHDVSASAASPAGKDTGYTVAYPAATKFVELPLSRKTKQGLARAGYKKLTDIQRAAIPHALVGRDVLGAAKTGSGKTLAFVLPLLERLYRSRWGPTSGLGAVVMSPTRELALQIFDELRKVGLKHPFSAGLVIGGKDFVAEQRHIGRCNIIIATPGRLLQHMDQTVGFDVSTVHLLVLDEADRILDMGFSKDVDAILQHLPRKRQTLLFSATQTRSLKDLARLSLTEPEYVAVHEADTSSTPVGLTQCWMEVALHEKLNTMWSFVKTHLRSKTIVFLTSCNQVRATYETFRRLRPGTPVLALHGKLKQKARMGIFYRFVKERHAVLFATDIAARGLDFPSVDWVVQGDCPDSPASYIHRVGRTARYQDGGQALLLLLPSEAAMVDALEAKRIPIQAIQANPSKLHDIANQVRGLLSEDPDLKFLVQKSFISYMKSVNMQSNKDVFDVHSLPYVEYAQSLGLPGAPKIKFRSGSKRKKKNLPYKMQEELRRADEEDRGVKREAKKHLTKVDRMLTRRNQGVLSDARRRMIGDLPDDVAPLGGDDAEEAPLEASSESEQEDSSADESSSSEDEVQRAGGRVGIARAQKPTFGDQSSSSSSDEDDGDGFWSMKRRNHELPPEVDAAVDDAHVERVLSQGTRTVPKRKAKPLGTRTVFDSDDDDEEGEGGDAGRGRTGLSSMGKHVDKLTQDELQASRATFVSSVQKSMNKADLLDKERVRQQRREQRRERKRKAKRSRAEESNEGMVVTIGGNSEESQSEEEDSRGTAPKRSMQAIAPKQPGVLSLADQEALALQLLEAGGGL